MPTTERPLAPTVGQGLSDWQLLRAPLFAMALLWTLVPALVHTAQPLDVVESALWGREWVVGTYKHPAMPAWLLEMGRILDGGSIGWPAYAASQLCSLATLAMTYLLARDLAGGRVAVGAVLSLLGVEYFSWRSIEFNHTQAQLPFWIGAALCAWRAVDRGTLVWWFALGALAALGLYAKLSNAMLLIVIAGWILWSAKGRATLATSGPYLGALAFAVLCVPLILWLVSSGLQPLKYASARGRDQTLLATLLFPVNAALQIAPVALTLAVAGLFARRAGPPLLRARPAPRTPEARSFLWIMALAPPLLSIALALAGGSGLRVTWLAPALPLLAVLALVMLQSRSRDDDFLSDVDLCTLRRNGLVLAIAIPALYAVTVPYLSRVTSAPLLRVSWPQVSIAEALSTGWKRETNKPLRIVAGSAWAAGLVAIDHPNRPSILTDGNLAYSPWITPERLRREGALVVWTEGRTSSATADLMAMTNGLPIREIRIGLPRGKPGDVVVFKYAVVPPQ